MGTSWTWCMHALSSMANLPRLVVADGLEPMHVETALYAMAGVLVFHLFDEYPERFAKLRRAERILVPTGGLALILILFNSPAGKRISSTFSSEVIMKISWKLLLAPVFALFVLSYVDKAFLLPEVRDRSFQPGGIVCSKQRERQIDRMREYAKAKPPDIHLAVVLGDSRSFAIGNFRRSTWQKELEDFPISQDRRQIRLISTTFLADFSQAFADRVT